MHLSKLLLFMATLAALSGCAAWFVKGEIPDVLVANITPLDSTPFEQRRAASERWPAPLRE
jgi:hypothetical protein